MSHHLVTKLYHETVTTVTHFQAKSKDWLPLFAVEKSIDLDGWEVIPWLSQPTIHLSKASVAPSCMQQMKPACNTQSFTDENSFQLGSMRNEKRFFYIIFCAIISRSFVEAQQENSGELMEQKETFSTD